MNTFEIAFNILNESELYTNTHYPRELGKTNSWIKKIPVILVDTLNQNTPELPKPCLCKQVLLTASILQCITNTVSLKTL